MVTNPISTEPEIATADVGISMPKPADTGRPTPKAARSYGFLSGLLSNRKALAGAIILLIFVLTAIFAPWLAQHEPNEFVARPHQPPSGEY